MAYREVCLKTENSDRILDALRGPQPTAAEMSSLHRAVSLDKEASRLLTICPPALQKQMLDVVVNRIRRVRSHSTHCCSNAAAGLAVVLHLNRSVTRTLSLQGNPVKNCSSYVSRLIFRRMTEEVCIFASASCASPVCFLLFQRSWHELECRKLASWYQQSPDRR